MKMPRGLSSFALMLSIAGGAVVVLVIVIVIVMSGGNGTTTLSLNDVDPMTIRYWRVFDDEDDFESIIKTYEATHPKVTIEYKKLRYDEYSNELFRAWAAGEGPDVFSIPNHWVGEFQPLLAPLPGTIEVPTLETKTTLGVKKETVVKLQPTRSMTISELQNTFVSTVPDDVVRTDATDGTSKIYALPLATDSLVLYVNRDMLSQSGIALPPTSWSELASIVPSLVIEDELGGIARGGVAMGTSENIERSFDILSLLMMQASNDPTALGKIGRGGIFVPSLANEDFGSWALDFYTAFASPFKTAYGWSDDMPDSAQAFIEGKVAMFLGYSYHIPQIERTPTAINYSIAPVPQITPANSMSYADYWVEGVFSRSEHVQQAWDFVQFITSSEQASTYVENVGRPAARFDLIAAQQESHPELKVFLDQALTSRSWYHGVVPLRAEQIFDDMITNVHDGSVGATDAVRAGNDQLKTAERNGE